MLFINTINISQNNLRHLNTLVIISLVIFGIQEAGREIFQQDFFTLYHQSIGCIQTSVLQNTLSSILRNTL
ncbi:hypothetical protein IHE45_20G020900 [Dioscorea alata]|uniref:Uncharacterized protein n=1 Tax=Dioscorea alata TaxID=55571 RepID=A0ACB7TR64_DIOAL|nr:hypothetical protein IHE45_20G020900 [Dioscorea alata]